MEGGGSIEGIPKKSKDIPLEFLFVFRRSSNAHSMRRLERVRSKDSVLESRLRKRIQRSRGFESVNVCIGDGKYSNGRVFLLIL